MPDLVQHDIVTIVVETPVANRAASAGAVPLANCVAEYPSFA